MSDVLWQCMQYETQYDYKKVDALRLELLECFYANRFVLGVLCADGLSERTSDICLIAISCLTGSRNDVIVRRA